MNYKSSFCVISGITKPNSIEQPVLIGLVLQFVQQFVPDFYASDISWVRSLKSSRFGVLNVQCRTVLAAARVRSTFASLVKAKPVPAFIGKVISQFFFEQMINNLSDKVYSVDSLVGINFSLLIRVVFYRFPYHSHYKSGPGFEFP